MGTRGFKIYRHKARYFVHHNYYDSYPEGFGLVVLSEVPHGGEFEEWLARMRGQLDLELELLEASGCPSIDDHPESFPDWVTGASQE
ncbi:hypothetical protein BOTBODRAFT_26372 [Botryobasidium botryosum FD-172 SS1]|uniref:Uncharacterized protein n=1 Tax=Botryobasidium botryosum (strain FD-172 SS1) TaxID=930990 RepID=A0A067N9E2_BOTB1|nr:hypothetical protein BOTBODRAFT_26372 [Botryobasidium botryosum FD-172 SS1]